MNMGRILRTIMIVGLFGQASLALHAQQLLDDFNRPADNVVGYGWTEIETGAAGAQINADGRLMLERGNPAANGRELVTRDVTEMYGVRLDTNSCAMTWAFCMRQSRPSPSGFAGGNYGVAFVLGSTTADFRTTGHGYAVVSSTTNGPVRLVRFNNGLAGTLTPIVTSATNFGAGYLAVRVVYTPAGNNWELFVNTISPVANFSTTNPVTAAVTSVGTGTNNASTGVGLPNLGALWNRSTGAGEAALFDNIHVPELCIPKVNFTSTATSNIENSGTPVTVNMSIFPAAVATGDIVITASGTATYGTDYTVSGTGVVVTGGPTITVTVGPGATTASFNINIIDDLVDEGNETITFMITSTTGGLALGTELVYTHTIIDNDGPPQVNFTTTNVNVLEGAPVQNFNLSISPTVGVAVTVQITITNGPGLVYGQMYNAALGTDYNVGGYLPPPLPATGVFNVVIPANASGISFTAAAYDDPWYNNAAPQIDLPIETATFTITGVTGGGATIGATSTAYFNISDNDAPGTVLAPGDLAIVGVNANNGACSGNTGEDIVSFFCFKPITYGTKIIITDNGYARCTAGTWGNNEGTVELTRTGTTIPAGQVITWRITGLAGANNVVGLAPDAGWSCASLNGFTSVNMNAGGDQLFFMQGGTWAAGTIGSHDATYSGTVLYGFSTVAPPNSWAAFAGACTNSGANQRSLLPLGMSCFSMAPATSSDFNKYTGSRAPKTQRDWMMALDIPGNWTRPPNCASYNSTAPNWLIEPPLPIIVGGFTPGLWRGGTSTDWFECKNWDDITVPGLSTPVEINSAYASNSCVVGVAANGAAQCASLLHTSSGGTVRHLTVQNNSTLTIDGPLHINRSVAGGALTTSITGTSALNCSTLTITGVTPGATNEAILQCESPTATVQVESHLTINTGGLLDLQGAGTGGALLLGGDWTNNESGANFQDQYSLVTLNGNVDQNLVTATGSEVFGSLAMAKSGGSLVLNSPIEVRSNLTLTTGRIMTGANTVTMQAGSATTGASDASFVHGPVVKVGLTDFIFPIGKGNALRTASLTGISGSGAFQAEYFPASGWTWGTPREATIHHVSDCEYWLIDRSSGTPSATVVLSWRAPYSCGVDDPYLGELRVARWDADALPAPGIWRDRGNGGTTGNFASGTVRTGASQSLFNSSGITPWTLASITENNPLPITLVDFTARPEGNTVRLDWVTASEHRNAFFTVERSRDGAGFEHVLAVPGAINSNVRLSYTELDPSPYPGLSYYRLRQTDEDGTSTVSDMVAVLFGTHDRPLVIFGNGGDWTALHAFAAGSRYEIVDMTGRRVLGGTTAADGRTDLHLDLSHGAYVFRITDGERGESQRFVY